jgi:hypothetical protein
MTPKPAPKRKLGRPAIYGTPLVTVTLKIPPALKIQLEREAIRESKPGARVTLAEVCRRRLERPA